MTQTFFQKSFGLNGKVARKVIASGHLTQLGISFEKEHSRQYEYTLECLISNACNVIAYYPPGTQIPYMRERKYYKKSKIYGDLSCEALKKYIDAFAKAGLLISRAGHHNWSKKAGNYSCAPTIEPTPKFVEWLKSIPSLDIDKSNPDFKPIYSSRYRPDAPDVVVAIVNLIQDHKKGKAWIRDEKKNILGYLDHVSHDLEKINQWYSKNPSLSIPLADLLLHSIHQSRKGVSVGGRISAGCQNYRKEERSTWTDHRGVQMIELDIVSCHPAMMYSKVGEELLADAYYIPALGDLNTSCRKLIKKIVNTAFNSDSETATVRSTTKFLVDIHNCLSGTCRCSYQVDSACWSLEENKQEALSYVSSSLLLKSSLSQRTQSPDFDRTTDASTASQSHSDFHKGFAPITKKLVQLWQNQHPKISHFVNSDAGVLFQGLEGQAALQVLIAGIQEDLFIVNIHDAFFCPIDKVDRVQEITQSVLLRLGLKVKLERKSCPQPADITQEPTEPAVSLLQGEFHALPTPDQIEPSGSFGTPTTYPDDYDFTDDW